MPRASSRAASPTGSPAQRRRSSRPSAAPLRYRPSVSPTTPGTPSRKTPSRSCRDKTEQEWERVLARERELDREIGYVSNSSRESTPVRRRGQGKRPRSASLGPDRSPPTSPLKKRPSRSCRDKGEQELKQKFKRAASAPPSKRLRVTRSTTPTPERSPPTSPPRKASSRSCRDERVGERKLNRETDSVPTPSGESATPLRRGRPASASPTKRLRVARSTTSSPEKAPPTSPSRKTPSRFSRDKKGQELERGPAKGRELDRQVGPISTTSRASIPARHRGHAASASPSKRFRVARSAATSPEEAFPASPSRKAPSGTRRGNRESKDAEWKPDRENGSASTPSRETSPSGRRGRSMSVSPTKRLRVARDPSPRSEKEQELEARKGKQVERRTRATSASPTKRLPLATSPEEAPPTSPSRKTPSRFCQDKRKRELVKELRKERQLGREIGSVSTPSRESTPPRRQGRSMSVSPTKRPQTTRPTSPRSPARRKRSSSVPASSPEPQDPPPPPIVYDLPDDIPDPAPFSNGNGDSESLATFEPAHFLRCHSLRNDPADVHTELWDCKFRPGGGGDGIGDVVATCGGNSVCLLHVKTGTLLKKFSHPDIKERLGALAWSRLRLDPLGLRRIAILAVGGMSRVYLIHPDNLTWYASFSAGGRKCREVTTLTFHPRRSRWLFVATGECTVSLWDVGVPAPPLYDVTPRQLLQVETKMPPLSLAVLGGCEMLLVGCEDGLKGWEVTLDVVKGERRPRTVKYQLPSTSEGSEGEFVDSVAVLGEERVAVKCPERGRVYVWSVEHFQPQEGRSMSLTVDLSLEPYRELCLKNSQARYLGLGAGTSLLTAGDERGAIWIWNWRDGGAASGEPVNTLHWPRPRDDELARRRKVPLHRFPILVNRVCLSEDERCAVAVTNNNMVCIWRRADGDVELD